MRSGSVRALASAVLAGVTLLAMSACANPPGTDGDLTNQWPAMAAPAGWVPQAGDCTDTFATNLYRSAYVPVSCTSKHRYETVHVGTFTGAAADLDKPPSGGDEFLVDAFGECDTKVTEFVGGPWRDGPLWIGISLPSTGNWTGGARWFRCEVAVLEDVWTSTPVSWESSLKGELAKAGTTLRYACYLYDDTEDTKTVTCDKPHNGEYVGSVAVTEEWDKLADNLDSVHKKCLSAVAKYVGVPDDSDMQYRSGTVYVYPSKKDWEAGDHSVRCHLYIGKKITKSLKGAGNAGLPINYA